MIDKHINKTTMLNLTKSERAELKRIEQIEREQEARLTSNAKNRGKQSFNDAVITTNVEAYIF